jgi:hypothetical protein
MATAMTGDDRRAFLLHGTRAGVLSTVRKDGRPGTTRSRPAPCAGPPKPC